MLSYYLKSKKKTESKTQKTVKIKTKKIILLSYSTACISKKSRFIKE